MLNLNLAGFAALAAKLVDVCSVLVFIRDDRMFFGHVIEVNNEAVLYNVLDHEEGNIDHQKVSPWEGFDEVGLIDKCFELEKQLVERVLLNQQLNAEDKAVDETACNPDSAQLN